ncbi:transcriptional regulator [Steroidobacter agaridevorans]|uniref:Transcriptional regulator n=1 Tax=Steroidobacter agaridevorans TaxID=2695856 RepID=A0A829YNC4_9GAMM|nr:FecR domain-containing protein [Steroidobacter agaridevorans]GFE84835.1 transcriptional regulator [Steroidobacter agaridevorans]GFE91816.1 transcriptional regulator [Steroidobacter agaridevorans]
MDTNDRRARATHEATQWWNRLSIQKPTEVSQSERELFTEWLRESPLHVAEFLRVAHVHDSLERFKLWNEVEVGGAEAPDNIVHLCDVDERAPEESNVDREARSRVRTWAIAASSCLIAILGAWFALSLRGDVLESKLAERRQVMLEDGTVVQLEPETRLRVKFEDKLRRVELEHGRALFRVAKNPQRPFLVSADQTSVRAVGTAFGVESGARGVVVTVAEGKVAVTDSPKAQADGAEIYLTAGQQVTVQDSGAVAPVRVVDTTRALAWAQGQLVFENDTLADVIQEFNRYNRVQLSIDDAQLAARKVSGVFEATDSETLLAFIRESGAEISITRTDAGIVIGTHAR